MKNHLGESVSYDVQGKKLLIELDLSKELGVSKSGKSITLASTHGNKSISTAQGMITIGVNCYKPNPDYRG